MFVCRDCISVLVLGSGRRPHGSGNREDGFIHLVLPGMHPKRDNRNIDMRVIGFSGLLPVAGTAKPLTPDGIAAAAMGLKLAWGPVLMGYHSVVASLAATLSAAGLQQQAWDHRNRGTGQDQCP